MNEIWSGSLRKMTVTAASPVEYRMGGENGPLLNQYLGKKLSLHFEGKINCIECAVALKKSYQGGYCFPCTQKLAECDLCILKPELCHYAKGTCRQPKWGEEHCMIPHFVYLSKTSGVKVGITRHTQIPTRWIDQGATEAVPIFKVSTRLQSGLFEVLLGEQIADKTNWRKMLKGESSEEDLLERRDQLFEDCGEALDQLEEELDDNGIEFLEDEAVTELSYPVLEYPEKVKSMTLEKMPTIEGTLMGIKGQYLIFDTGVINIRRHTGHTITLKA
ncbi:MAG: DUF2797 domain-containing protein [Halobacteriovoraceae bacterium]|jgi:hypothetical protein|nr:DUF2797 domain-containing protein [Halobacteriovoraceae bacterium]